VKRARLSPFTLDAVTITGGRAEYSRVDVPTWDGSCWHFARLHSEAHVLHEVAHWIVATEQERAAPNYGLGTDPDRGPLMAYADPVLARAANCVRKAEEIAGRFTSEQAASVLRVAKILADERELEATVVTIFLVARVSRLRVEDHRSFRALVHERAEDAWLAVRRLNQRGIDPQNPLGPYEARRVSRSA